VPQIIEKRIRSVRSNVRIRSEIVPGVEMRPRRATLGGAIAQVVIDRVELPRGEVGIVGEIPIRVE
jgi:hypothetical protein